MLDYRVLEKLKEKWWGNHPNKAKCSEAPAEDSEGIPLQNIGYKNKILIFKI